MQLLFIIIIIINLFNNVLAKINNNKTNQLPSRRIVGGYEVKPSFKYSWIVSLQYKNKHSCGGTLLNKNTILTAAHCNIGQNYDWKANLHRHDLKKSNKEENGFIYSILQRIQHPNYNSETNAYDAAIWKINGNYNPTLIEFDNDVYSNIENKLLTVIGWGTTSSGGKASSILLEVKVPVYNLNKCKKIYQKRLDTVSQFCVGYSNGEKDSCQGDSGGPIFINNENQYVLVGIVSWGKGCALKDYPGVYTRISKVKDFIDYYLEDENLF